MWTEQTGYSHLLRCVTYKGDVKLEIFAELYNNLSYSEL